ncbi:hypothetical protein FAZ95_30110 [Trinickia violacea]|uniref:Uncharacterized protein n=1 Tax=Trinickia violacea TaxID=2571746 RepID=A0A4P8J374_9BURK|nr:hypothetical protein [Trinickia violacea]QCP54915.1 hypothetical protein FAZ95_30110 [Trinickia violacea]
MLLVWCLCGYGLVANAAAADDAQSLRDTYQSLTQQLAHNPFHRELALVSEESPSRLKGDIYAVMDYPFATVNGALDDPVRGPGNWCDVLILHLNIKYCHASSNDNASMLTVNLGRKVEEALPSTYRLQFSYHPVESSADYFKVELSADSGPLSTKDYRIVLEAVSISGNRTFLHLTYAYGYGLAGRLAMKTYLATLGADKVGFTSTSDPSSGKLQYIGGVRGLVERNTMRYYLAIDAYLGSLASPPDKQLAQRLATWFDATEQYPQQLHEVDRQDYLQMKNHEYQRQQTAQ